MATGSKASTTVEKLPPMKRTRLSARTVAVWAALQPVSGLAPGEHARVLVLGPTVSHVRQLLDACMGILDALKVEHAEREGEIRLKGRRTVICPIVADHLAPRSGTAVTGLPSAP